MLGLYLMSEKGVGVLRRLIAAYGSQHIAYVVTARDVAVEYDGHADILSIAKTAGIPGYLQPEVPEQEARHMMAVSWRWLIRKKDDQSLIVFHDSILPRYRGFSPLVSALINGEKEIGVTAILASDDYDRGPIIAQISTAIDYPITIAQAIGTITPCYENLASAVFAKLLEGQIDGYQQDERGASYSLWRDEDDYGIDWSWDADRIRRFVDAVGFPYKGASTRIGDKLYRVRFCEALPDVCIENRMVGKVIFVIDEKPVVVCGRGLLKILELTEDNSSKNILPLKRFRTRFG